MNRDAAWILRLIAESSGGDVWTAIGRLSTDGPPLDRGEVQRALRAGAETIDRAERIAARAKEETRLRAFDRTVRALAERLPDSTVGAAVEFFDVGLRGVFADEEEGAP